jgi:drug/metabolite transporter (DMT)-like permease
MWQVDAGHQEGDAVIIREIDSAVQNLGPTRTNAFINLAPVVTYLASFLILGEALGVAKLIGIAVVIAGVFISQSQKRVG